MEKRIKIFTLASGLIFTLLIFVSYTTDGGENSTVIDEPHNLPQIIEPVDLNRVFSFAGEEMPSNFDTKERLDRELLVNSYWHSNTMMNLKKSNKYFPIMERVLMEQGVPDDFKFLAVAESSLRNVVSPTNAKGFWQFRKAAGKEMGLEINDEVDERYHVEKATLAACKYIKQLKKRFGTWTNAAASYNVGPTNFRKILKSQGEESYYDLNINEETSRYLFRLIAIKEIVSNPSNFGFYVDANEMYPPLSDFYVVTIDKSVPSWKKFADEYGISYRVLKLYNPWLRDNKLTVVKNTYQVRVPR